MIDMAIVGATGLVGREMLALVEERRLPVGELRLVASRRSAGATVDWAGRRLRIEDLETFSPRGVQVALFSAGAEAARRHAPRFVEEGVRVIDNSSAHRRSPGVPLVVPEVNGAAVGSDSLLIANPNCSTIQLVVVLKPLLDGAGLRRVTVATYQSVSGVGQRGVDQLERELIPPAGAAPADTGPPVFPHPIASEALAHCGVFDDRGWSAEEQKIIDESRRILDLPELRITATAVRVPVRRSHSEAVWVETERPLDVAAARRLLVAAPGVELIDDPGSARYPRARSAAGGDQVQVGRIRRDPTVEHGLALWVVADNIRKGAALNAVQILETMIRKRVLATPLAPRRS